MLAVNPGGEPPALGRTTKVGTGEASAVRSATLPRSNRLARPCPTAPRTISVRFEFCCRCHQLDQTPNQKEIFPRPWFPARATAALHHPDRCVFARSQLQATTGLEARAPSNWSTWTRTRLVSSRLAIAAAMSTASVAVAEKSVPQTIGRRVLLFFPFICSVFVEVLRLRQGVIDTFKQPSRREPKTSYASTI